MKEDIKALIVAEYMKLNSENYQRDAAALKAAGKDVEQISEIANRIYMTMATLFEDELLALLKEDMKFRRRILADAVLQIVSDEFDDAERQ